MLWLCGISDEYFNDSHETSSLVNIDETEPTTIILSCGHMIKQINSTILCSINIFYNHIQTVILRYAPNFGGCLQTLALMFRPNN
jgi:hypothetical protein